MGLTSQAPRDYGPQQPETRTGTSVGNGGERQAQATLQHHCSTGRLQFGAFTVERAEQERSHLFSAGSQHTAEIAFHHCPPPRRTDARHNDRTGPWRGNALNVPGSGRQLTTPRSSGGAQPRHSSGGRAQLRWRGWKASQLRCPGAPGHTSAPAVHRSAGLRTQATAALPGGPRQRSQPHARRPPRTIRLQQLLRGGQLGISVTLTSEGEHDNRAIAGGGIRVALREAQLEV